MITIQLKENTTRRQISVSNVFLVISLLTIPLLIFTIHFLNTFFGLCIKFNYYEVGTTYFFNINIYGNYTAIMAIIHGLLASNIITVFIIMVLKLKRKHFLKPRKININGIQLAIFILLIVLSLIFLLYHNVAQLNQLTKVIQKIENSSNVANITYFGFQLPTNIALIDFFLIPGIIIIIIIIILVFIRK